MGKAARAELTLAVSGSYWYASGAAMLVQRDQQRVADSVPFLPSAILSKPPVKFYFQSSFFGRKHV